MESINKKTLTEVIADNHGMTKKQAADIVDLVFHTMAEALRDGKRVDITGFGKFEVKTRASRTGVNPQTNEPIEIPSSKVPGFKASKTLKDFVR